MMAEIFLSFILGIVTSGIVAYAAPKITEIRRLTWKEFQKTIITLIGEVSNYNPQFDAILGVGKSGSVVASVMSGNLGSIPIFAIQYNRLDNNSNQSKSAREINFVSLPPKEFVDNKHILILTYTNHAGETLGKIEEKLKESYGTRWIDYKTAALFHSQSASTKPNFIGKKVSPNRARVVLANAPWMFTPQYDNPSARFYGIKNKLLRW